MGGGSHSEPAVGGSCAPPGPCLGGGAPSAPAPSPLSRCPRTSPQRQSQPQGSADFTGRAEQCQPFWGLPSPPSILSTTLSHT